MADEEDYNSLKRIDFPSANQVKKEGRLYGYSPKEELPIYLYKGNFFKIHSSLNETFPMEHRTQEFQIKRVDLAHVNVDMTHYRASSYGYGANEGESGLLHIEREDDETKSYCMKDVTSFRLIIGIDYDSGQFLCSVCRQIRNREKKEKQE